MRFLLTYILLLFGFERWLCSTSVIRAWGKNVAKMPNLHHQIRRVQKTVRFTAAMMMVIVPMVAVIFYFFDKMPYVKSQMPQGWWYGLPIVAFMFLASVLLYGRRKEFALARRLYVDIVWLRWTLGRSGRVDMETVKPVHAFLRQQIVKQRAFEHLRDLSDSGVGRKHFNHLARQANIKLEWLHRRFGEFGLVTDPLDSLYKQFGLDLKTDSALQNAVKAEVAAYS